jgi:hypothetical protein
VTPPFAGFKVSSDPGGDAEKAKGCYLCDGEHHDTAICSKCRDKDFLGLRLRCNCAENAEHPKGAPMAQGINMRAWICPAHGYKSL